MSSAQTPASLSALNAQLTQTGHSLAGDMAKTLEKTLAQLAAMAPPAPVMKTKAPSGTGDGVFDTLFATLFLDMLFGMPLFQGLGVAGEAAHGTALMGTMLHGDTQTARRQQQLDSINAALTTSSKIRYARALQDQRRDARQMQALQKVTLLLLASIAQQSFQNGKETAQGPEQTLAPDVLRHPALARFKQNRHSLSCIRTQFSKAIKAVATHRTPVNDHVQLG